MKPRLLTLLFALLLFSITVRSGEYFLLPDSFLFHKGQAVNVRLFNGDGFDKPMESKYASLQTEKFVLYEGNKKTDLKPVAKDSTSPVISYTLNSTGLALVSMSRPYVDNEKYKQTFITEVDDEGQAKVYAEVSNSNKTKFNIRQTSYLKTLVQVDKPEGAIFNKDVGQDLELIPQQNPYMLSYGDDLTVLIKFKHKPLVNAHVDVLVKSTAGKVFTQRFNSDFDGNIYIKLNREGIYMLRLYHVIPSQIKEVDFEQWAATFTFAFTSANVLPSDSRGFGLGNKH